MSQITFSKKGTNANKLFLLGDAAGAIAPLCGNGMSMGMRASSILAGILDSYLAGKIDRPAAINKYATDWNKNFAQRIKAGYYLQQILGKNQLTDISLKVLAHTPKILQKIIGLTHGQPF